MSWQHPFDKKTITSRFGETARRDTPHRGTDYAPKANTLIPAVTDGRIEKIFWSSCLGWVAVQSSASKKYYIGYCHLSCHQHGINCEGPSLHKDGSTCMKNLKVGDTVAMGEWVGRTGNTGSCSRGAHLHLTLGRDVNSVQWGRVEDAEKYIDSQLKKNSSRNKATTADTGAQKSTPKATVKVCPTCKQEVK
jgi:murein DD-endopeptidase MepM/ murein hydrolase activator NlpD